MDHRRRVWEYVKLYKLLKHHRNGFRSVSYQLRKPRIEEYGAQEQAWKTLCFAQA